MWEIHVTMSDMYVRPTNMWPKTRARCQPGCSIPVPMHVRTYPFMGLAQRSARHCACAGGAALGIELTMDQKSPYVYGDVDEGLGFRIYGSGHAHTYVCTS